MNKFLGIFAGGLLTAGALASFEAMAGQDKYGPYNMQSGKVHAVGIGKTARREQWHRAPLGHFFREGSWKITPISANGINAGCKFEGLERKPIAVTLQNGNSVTLDLVTGFKVTAHAETGSYTGGRTAWAECKISAVLEEHD